MASLLRQIVAGPRARHPEAGLDLCYVTDNIVVTSGPSQSYPQRAYRNPLDRLVAFLDAKHGKNWAIWEFRAEGTGYPDELVYDRVNHYPWPDHHPPPFRLVPLIMASMRNWLDGKDLDSSKSTATGTAPEGVQKTGDTVREDDKGKDEIQDNEDGKEIEKEKDKDKEHGNILNRVIDVLKDHNLHKTNPRVIVVHCKAGKGRSGTMTCSYLISQCGWTPEQALARFTERRMRPKFGPGVSIPSQLRWIGYVDRWAKSGTATNSSTDVAEDDPSRHRRVYIDREVEVVEVRALGLRHGVKVAIEGFVEQGKKIKVFHTFQRDERTVMGGDAPGGSGLWDTLSDMAGYGSITSKMTTAEAEQQINDAARPSTVITSSTEPNEAEVGTDSSTTNQDNKPSRASRLLSNISRSASVRSKASSTQNNPSTDPPTQSSSSTAPLQPSKPASTTATSASDTDEPGGQTVIFRPKTPIRLPTSDINLTLERRSRAPSSMGLAMVTALAHVWFNVYFEGGGPEAPDNEPAKEGTFEIEWGKMDGLKGSSQKGTRALEKVGVVWRAVGGGEALDQGGKGQGVKIKQPGTESPVPQTLAAGWKGDNEEDPAEKVHLGLRKSSKDGVDGLGEDGGDTEDEMQGVRTDVPPKGSKKGKDEGLEAYKEKLPKPDGGKEEN